MLESQRTSGMAAQISDGIVRLHKEYYGKGPEQAKTYLVSDTVMCMLRGGFTTVERTLIDDGKRAQVEDVRRSFQHTMRSAFVGVVEDATSRTVLAYMSQVHTDPDLAVELFVLEPHDEHIVEEHELSAIGE